MHNFGTLFLWVLASCNLWVGSLAEDLQTGSILPQGVEAKLEDQHQQAQAKLEDQHQTLQTNLGVYQAKLNESLLAVQTRLETQFQAALSKVENQLQAMSNKMDELERAVKVRVPDLVGNTIPHGFEQIGTRYFHVANERVDWATARIRCYEMGGFLATFQNEDEFSTITAKLPRWQGYWLGINRDTNGHFVSVASHKPVQFLKWHKADPNDENHLINCALLHQGEMWDHNCSTRWNFICQAGNET
ncbi:accessory gland protein Acp29AB-like [Drosophila kikkawai]|uniref:Accessory gland protein Acp29AB-like n=1 Tax=Drosophila kikkawai TaxID=30033 RepID=A0A6P4IM18_DROKI